MKHVQVFKDNMLPWKTISCTAYTRYTVYIINMCDHVILSLVLAVSIQVSGKIMLLAFYL